MSGIPEPSYLFIYLVTNVSLKCPIDPGQINQDNLHHLYAGGIDLLGSTGVIIGCKRTTVPNVTMIAFIKCSIKC